MGQEKSGGYREGRVWQEEESGGIEWGRMHGVEGGAGTGWGGRGWNEIEEGYKVGGEWGHVCHTINSIGQDHSPIFIRFSISIILLVPPCYHHNQN